MMFSNNRLINMKPLPLENATSTRDRILDAAEELFVEMGYAATSLRAIAQLADVNLAATNYHFGSKEGLLAAIVHRHIHPVNTERLSQLKALEDSGRLLTLREILNAFFYPLADTLPNSQLPAVMGRILSEPESLTRPIMTEQFAEVVERFQAAAATVLPGLTEDELSWRFHLLIGSMIHLLKFPAPIGSNEQEMPFRHSIEHLITFVMAGLSHGQGAQDG